MRSRLWVRRPFLSRVRDRKRLRPRPSANRCQPRSRLGRAKRGRSSCGGRRCRSTRRGRNCSPRGSIVDPQVRPRNLFVGVCALSSSSSWPAVNSTSPGRREMSNGWVQGRLESHRIFFSAAHQRARLGDDLWAKDWAPAAYPPIAPFRSGADHGRNGPTAD